MTTPQATTDCRDVRFRVTVKFAWYDLWVGAYFDRDNKQLYLCPVPMLAIRIGHQ